MTDLGSSAAAGSAGGDESPRSLASADSVRQRVLDQIEIWRKELINVARSNRLLYFRHTKSSTLEIVREPDRIDEVVARLVAGRAWRFYMPPDPAPDAQSPSKDWEANASLRSPESCSVFRPRMS
jgi:hypothetical protein